jgi:NAD(P)H-hydrate epimerase
MDSLQAKGTTSLWFDPFFNYDKNFERLNDFGELDKFDIIIDGILGTGISGEIREPQASAITFINKQNAFKLAVDVPSGLNPDTGETNQVCVKADMTVTFHRMKVGMPKRTDVCGEIYVEKIGIPPEAEIGVL